MYISVFDVDVDVEREREKKKERVASLLLLTMGLNNWVGQSIHTYIYIIGGEVGGRIGRIDRIGKETVSETEAEARDQKKGKIREMET